MKEVRGVRTKLLEQSSSTKRKKKTKRRGKGGASSLVDLEAKRPMLRAEVRAYQEHAYEMQQHAAQQQEAEQAAINAELERERQSQPCVRRRHAPGVRVPVLLGAARQDDPVQVARGHSDGLPEVADSVVRSAVYTQYGNIKKRKWFMLL